MAIPTPPDCTNTSEVRVATCETTQDLQEWLTKTIADGLTTNYSAKGASQLVSEAFSQYLQTQVSVKYVWVYDWADATARNAQVGMTAGEYGHQIDTDAVYEYNGASWDLVTVAVGEQSYNVITSEVLKFATSWDLFYALASATQVDSNTTSITTLNKLDDSITIDMTADADQVLTAEQIPYGRIEITDTGTPITQQRTITLDNTEHTFLFVNNADFPLNVIALGGAGVVVNNGESKELRNNTVGIIEFEGASTLDLLSDFTIGQEITISSWSFVSTTTTINTAVPHSLTVGQKIRVNGLVSTTNTPQGIYTVATVEDTDTITITTATTPTGSPTVSSATLNSGDIKAFGKFIGRNGIIAFAKVDCTTSPPTIIDSFNIKDVSNLSTGRNNFEFTEQPATADYEVAPDIIAATANRNATFGNPTTAGFDIYTSDLSNSVLNGIVTVIVIGGQY